MAAPRVPPSGASTATCVLVLTPRAPAPVGRRRRRTRGTRPPRSSPRGRLRCQRLRKHHDRGPDAGARQSGGQPGVRRRRDVQNLGRAGAGREPRSPGLGTALDQRQPGVRDRPRGQVRLDLERPVLAGKEQAAAGPGPSSSASEAAALTAASRWSRRTVTAGVDDDERAASRCRRAAAARAVQPRARAPASGSSTPACPDGRDEGRRPRWRRTARSAPRRSAPPPLLPRPGHPLHPFGAREDEQLLRRRRAQADTRASSSASETISVGGSTRRRPRRGNEATIRTLATVPPESSDIGPRIDTGSPASGSTTAAPGSPQCPRVTSIVASIGSLLDHALGLELALDRGAPRGQRDPHRRDDPEQRDRDPGHEQRRGVEQQRHQDQRQPGDHHRRRPSHRSRSSSGGVRAGTRGASQRSHRRDGIADDVRRRLRADSGASTSR